MGRDFPKGVQALSSTGVVTILGVTGRLGPAVARAFLGWEIRGLSRRDFLPGEVTPPLSLFRISERGSEEALSEVLEGSDVVVDLVCFSGEDAGNLIRVCAELPNPPTRLVFASSAAQLAQDSDDPYSRGKQDAHRVYLKSFQGRSHTLILPRLVACVDHARRDQPYLDTAAGGRALIRGSGEELQSTVAVEDVATCILRIVSENESFGEDILELAPSQGVRVKDAVSAILEGARLPQVIARHPDLEWKGPHGGGEELLNPARFEAWFPGFQWTDPLESYRKLGRWLAYTQKASNRPRLQVKGRHQEFLGNRVVDVHDRRVEVPLEKGIPGLRALADWLSPSFYVDLGRPCNSACIYCAIPPHADTQGFSPMEQVSKQIASGLSVGCDRAILIGGEPTIYPNLDGVFQLLHDAGLFENHVVMTNGIRFADRQFLESLVLKGLRTVHLSMDTAEVDTYDAISRSKGRFPKQLEALSNILGYAEIRRYIYSAVTRMTSAGLESLMQLVSEASERANVEPPSMVFAFVKPIGDAQLHADKLLQGYEERASIARRVVERASQLGLTVGFRNLQACLVPELVEHLVDYYLDDYSVDLETHRRRPNAHGVNWKKVQACEECGHSALCTGIYRGDINRLGETGFVAIGRQGLSES